MNNRVAHKQYYVYGSDKLLSDLRELIDSAADFEEQNKTSKEWLEYNNFDVSDINVAISWGTAINIVIRERVHELERKDKDNGDYSFPF